MQEQTMEIVRITDDQWVMPRLPGIMPLAMIACTGPPPPEYRLEFIRSSIVDLEQMIAGLNVLKDSSDNTAELDAILSRLRTARRIFQINLYRVLAE